MSDFEVGNRIRFTARFRLGGKLFDPTEVTATVESPPGHLRHVGVTRAEAGVYWAHVVARDSGSVVVTFTASSGEFSRVEYTAAAQTPRAEALSDVTPVEPVKPRLNREAARRRLLAAGFPVDDSWSDAKLGAAVEGLERVERDRRVWKF